jgi:hypothetical protein
LSIESTLTSSTKSITLSAISATTVAIGRRRKVAGRQNHSGILWVPCGNREKKLDTHSRSFVSAFLQQTDKKNFFDDFALPFF